MRINILETIFNQPVIPSFFLPESVSTNLELAHEKDSLIFIKLFASK